MDEKFSKTWQDMSGDSDIADEYIMETASSRFVRLTSYGAAAAWAGRGFDRPADDGEPVCYRSGIGIMVHGPGCCCESTP